MEANPARGLVFVVTIALILGSVPLAASGQPVEVGDPGESEPVEEAEEVVEEIGDEAPIAAKTLGDSDETAGGSGATLASTSPVPTLRYTSIPTFEPTIGATSDGDLFMSAFGFEAEFPALLGWTAVQSSSDGGETWQDVTPRIQDIRDYPVQSNDPYVHVDQHTDRIFVIDLQALMCSTLAFSDDGGETWTKNPIGCGHPVGGHDHQTLWTAPPATPTDAQALAESGYGSVVYYCVNRVADTACAKSLDGGQSFGPLRPLIYNTDHDWAPEPIGENASEPIGRVCGGLTYHGVGDSTGTVYLPTAKCGEPTVGVSQDGGLTWDAGLINATEAVNTHDLPLAVDDADNLYAAWTNGSRDARFSVSTDQGQTWTDPITIQPADVEAVKFPALAAGADGELVAAYYGTSTPGDQLGGNTTWDAYLTLIQDATSDTPTIDTVRLNPAEDPMARGACSGRCDGIGDFIDAAVGPDGRPWGAFVDVCNSACAAPYGKANRGDRGVAGTIREGPSLTASGTLSTLSPTPPDLQALDISAGSDLVQPGQQRTITATVGNLGDSAAAGVEVEFLAEGMTIGSTTIDDLAGRSQVQVQTSWTPSAGAQTLEVIVDPGDAVAENYEDNNRANSTVQAGCATPGPGGSGYTCEVVSNGFVDVSATGREIGILDESGEFPFNLTLPQNGTYRTVDLPFAFPFFGSDRDQVHLSDNGFLALGPDVAVYIATTGCCEGQATPDPRTPNDLITGFWEDLDPSAGGSVLVEALSIDGQDAFVVQFADVPHWPNTAPVTFQYQLFEDGTIEVHYEAAPSDGGTHGAGIEGPAGAQGLSAIHGDVSINDVGVRYTPPS